MSQLTSSKVAGITSLSLIGWASGVGLNKYVHTFVNDEFQKRAQERIEHDVNTYFSEELRAKADLFGPRIEVMEWIWPALGADPRTTAGASTGAASSSQGISTTGPVLSPGGRGRADRRRRCRCL